MHPRQLIYLSVILLLLLAACERNTKPEVIAAPLISPQGGEYTPEQLISITCSSPGAVIHFTMDADDPEHNSPLYTSALRLADILPQISNRITIKARAFKQDLGWSPTTTASFRVNYPNTVERPVITPDAVAQELGAEVLMAVSDPDAQIRYTLDGSLPTYRSNLYTGPVHISRGGYQTVMAAAFKAGWNPSLDAWREYFIPLPGPPLLLVQGGSFVHGPANVSLNSFYISPHELIQSHYYAIMNAGMPYIPIEISAPSPGHKAPTQDARLEYPAYYLSWFDAIEYCNRRSILENLEPCYSYTDPQIGFTAYPETIYPHYWPQGWNQDPANQNKISCAWDANGYRLPTEAEWTFAARGGNLSVGNNYSGHRWVDPCAWFNLNAGHSTQPIGLKLRNELDLYDMSGNLSEWCWDLLGSLPEGSLSNPTGPSTGYLRVLKGGSWYSDSLACMVVSRAAISPATTNAASVGMRVVRSASR